MRHEHVNEHVSRARKRARKARKRARPGRLGSIGLSWLRGYAGPSSSDHQALDDGLGRAKALILVVRVLELDAHPRGGRAFFVLGRVSTMTHLTRPRRRSGALARPWCRSSTRTRNSVPMSRGRDGAHERAALRDVPGVVGEERAEPLVLDVELDGGAPLIAALCRHAPTVSPSFELGKVPHDGALDGLLLRKGPNRLDVATGRPAPRSGRGPHLDGVGRRRCTRPQLPRACGCFSARRPREAQRLAFVFRPRRGQRPDRSRSSRPTPRCPTAATAPTGESTKAWRLGAALTRRGFKKRRLDAAQRTAPSSS